MCVIAVAAKKRHMKREEVLQAIKANGAGFFGFTVHDGARRTIRTLDEKQFLKFFDDVVEDDDPWAMHARIPSRGEKNLDNVHGWEEDGIIFCHNMTLSELDGMMKRVDWKGTDSEFFFRHVFMPFYRGCGKDAYRDGRFCEDLDNLVRHFCGTYNKLLFIMPDNRMIRYGSWVEEGDRKEGDEVAFHASNSSYKTFEPRWPAAPRTVAPRRIGWYGDEYCGFDAEDDMPPPPAPAGAVRTVPDSHVDIAPLVRRTLGDRKLCEMALLDIIANGAVTYRAGPWTADGRPDDDARDALADLMPSAFSPESYGTAVEGVAHLADADPKAADAYSPEDLAAAYAKEVATVLVKDGALKINGTSIVPYYVKAEHVQEGAKAFVRSWRTFARIMCLDVDFEAKTPAKLVCMADCPDRSDGRCRVAKVQPEDILVDEGLTAAETFCGVGRLLEFIRRRPTGKETA